MQMLFLLGKYLNEKKGLLELFADIFYVMLSNQGMIIYSNMLGFPNIKCTYKNIDNEWISHDDKSKLETQIQQFVDVKYT